MAETARRLIEANGAEVTWTRRTGQAYDPSTSLMTSTSAQIQLLAVIASAGKDDVFKAEAALAAQGGAVGQGFHKVMFAAKGLTNYPVAGDMIGPIDGRTWRVVTVDAERVTGLPVMFTVVVTS